MIIDKIYMILIMFGILKKHVLLYQAMNIKIGDIKVFIFDKD